MNDKEFARTITNGLNSFGVNYKGIVSELRNEHKTLQQNFTKLCIEWLKRCGTDDERFFDDRNIASHELGKKLLPVLEDAYLPFI